MKIPDILLSFIIYSLFCGQINIISDNKVYSLNFAHPTLTS